MKKPVATVHTGVSVVDQEIQRQRERDSQLRAERELLATASLASPSSSPVVSPAATGAGGFVDARPPQLVDAERLSKRRTFDGESSLVHEMDAQRQREEELRQQRDVNGHADRRAPAGHVINQTRGASGTNRRTTRVQPFRDSATSNDDDDDESGSNARLSFITPRNETLIEREIRITRQREGSLRRVRGYPAVSQPTSVEVPVSGFGRRSPTSTSPRQDDKSSGEGRGIGTANDDVAMKRLATNRLRQEILRERKREVDLRNQGKIYTISEEHIERPLLLTEIVAASSTSPPSRTSPRGAREDDSHQKETHNDGRHHSAASIAHRYQQQHQHHQSPAQSQQPVRPQQQNAPAKRRLIGEKLIEQEVRELRRREQELRSHNLH